MIYAKPQVDILGEAFKVIELLNPPKMWWVVDSWHMCVNPAYDLDE